LQPLTSSSFESNQSSRKKKRGRKRNKNIRGSYHGA
jgi:hypothetical protein